jgi:uncharacterized low-complexity protein
MLTGPEGVLDNILTSVYRRHISNFPHAHSISLFPAGRVLLECAHPNPKLVPWKGACMKRFTCAALLALTFVVPSAFAQNSGSPNAGKEGGRVTEKASKQKAREGQDCDTSRAGVRCNRPKPKKVWFFGKA